MRSLQQRSMKLDAGRRLCWCWGWLLLWGVVACWSVAVTAAEDEGPAITEVDGLVVRAQSGDAVDEGLTCDSPLIGNSCLVYRCTDCAEAIPDATSGLRGFLSSGVLITTDELAALGLRECTINDVNVAVELVHSHLGDLSLIFGTPTAPNNVSAFFYFPDRSCSANSLDSVFDDEAAGARNACPAPPALSTHARLDELDGRAPDERVWRLEVFDDEESNTGTLMQWGFAMDVTCERDCVPDSETFCLNQSRFLVEAEWRDFEGNRGSAKAVPVESEDSGLFYFFDPDNWEMLVKVLDGCPVNDRFWVFSAATTNVEYTLRVTDTETGEAREYFNPLGTSSPAITDTDAFATCP